MLKSIVLIWIVFFTIPSQVLSAEFYVSTSGSDSNLGDSSSPWLSIDNSINRLQPGDILYVYDGEYFENVKPLISGTSSNPIVIKAINPFGAIINGGGIDTALLIKEVSYLEFDGFKVLNSGEIDTLRVNSKDGQPATGNTDTHHIKLKRMSIRGSCAEKNCTAFQIARSNDILVEDSWVFGAGRYTFNLYGARKVTLRRIVVRWDQWNGTEYKPNDPRFAFGLYNSNDNTIENMIILDSGEAPQGTTGDKGATLMAGGDNGITSPFVSSSNNNYFGLIIYNNIGKGIAQSSRVEPHRNNTFNNSVVFDNTKRSFTISNLVENTTINNVTFSTSPERGLANFSNSTSNIVLTNSIIVNNSKGAFYGDLTESYNMLFGNSPNYTSSQPIGPNSIIEDPALKYILSNETAPLEFNLGSNNKFRGANVFYRYFNGVESSQKLWPWLFENEIYKDFCNATSLAELNRVGLNTPGWCASGKSLTRYLWESYGVLDCPEEVCLASPDPVVDQEEVDEDIAVSYIGGGLASFNILILLLFTILFVSVKIYSARFK